MHRVIYTSVESFPFSEEDLKKLLEQSRRYNTEAGITGFLLYEKGKFLQLLEGPPEPVLALVEKIKSDPRHGHFTVLMDSETPTRTFNEWSMGFKRLQPGDVRALLGYADFDDLVFNANQLLLNPSNVLRLLVSSSDDAPS